MLILCLIRPSCTPTSVVGIVYIRLPCRHSLQGVEFERAPVVATSEGVLCQLVTRAASLMKGRLSGNLTNISTLRHTHTAAYARSEVYNIPQETGLESPRISHRFLT